LSSHYAYYNIANTVNGDNNTNYVNTAVITANSENYANNATNIVQFLGRASANEKAVGITAELKVRRQTQL